MRLSSTLCLLLVGVLWGLNWPAVKFMMSELPPFTIRAIAFPFAAVLLTMIAIFNKENLRPSRQELLPLIVTGTLLVFAFNMLTSWGQTLSEASQAAIVAYTMPAMTALLAVFYLKDPLNTRIVIALGLGMLGIALLIWRDLAILLARPTGVIVMLCAALFWSIGNIALKSHPWRLQASARAAWFFAISTVVSWPVVWFLEDPANLQIPSIPVMATLSFHVLGPMVLCYLLWAVLVSRLSVSVAAISVLTAPVVGVFSAVVLLGEELSWHKIAALLLILASIVFTHLPASTLPTSTKV